ncbi:MAG TPA: ABC transporter ATP-binding protein [Casimicrobiaceae bacterium]|jgi:branched-chain amino acid transport system ATP-binding protein|nr:ABC transporter ATP-binding protein [Casimicrobiaceae bacterium]
MSAPRASTVRDGTPVSLPPAAVGTDRDGEVLLRARGIVRRFGGLTAVDGVSIDLARGSVHAVIGTNGAGKSTLVNVLAGELAADAGTIMLGGIDVTRASQPWRARRGLGRTYQRSTVFMPFTVLENCRLCAQGRFPAPFAPDAAARCARSLAAARDALARTGLAALADRIAATLSHGQRRQLEVAMCLATAPQVLLLDEPLAGMGAEETAAMLELLASLREGHAILLVEHDMDAVFRIADRITVMVNGAVIATDAPAAVRANADVQTAYLGESA